MSGQSARSLPRNPGIDLLRGLSILLVLLNHIGLRIPLTKGVLAAWLPTQVLTDLNFNGSEAVDLFFVISGFLIATHSIVRWGGLGAIDARAFYVRRAARILPCLLALVAVLSLLHLAGVHDYVIHRAGQSLPRAVLSALGLHLNWYEAHTGYLPPNWDVLWSLSIEEVFYLGFPLACLAARKDRFLAPFLILLAALQPWSLKSIINPIWREKAYLPGMAAIAVGVLAAMIAAHWQRPPRWFRSVCLAAGACGVAGVLGMERQLWHWLGWGTLLVLTCSGGILVLAFYWKGIDNPTWSLPGTRWMQSFGRLSYEIYLTHMFVVLAMLSVYYDRGGNPRHGVLWYIPAIAGSWLLGWIVARFFTDPTEKKLRRLWLRPADHTVRRQAPVAG